MSARPPYAMCWRDRLAHRLANACLRLATPTYRSFVSGAVLYGLDAAARDAHEGRDLPPSWRSYAGTYTENPTRAAFTPTAQNAPSEPTP